MKQKKKPKNEQKRRHQHKPKKTYNTRKVKDQYNKATSNKGQKVFPRLSIYYHLPTHMYIHRKTEKEGMKTH